MGAADSRNSVPPGRARPFFAFVWTVVALAAAFCVRPLIELPAELPRLPVAFWVMAALAVGCDARPFVPPGRRQTSAVFPSTCFTFAILLGWGFGPAILVQAVAVVVSGWRMGHAPWRTAFNAAQYAAALGAAYAVTWLGPGSIFDGGRLRGTDVLAVGGATVAWFVVNYALVSAAVRLRFGDRWWPSLRQGLGFELLSTGSLLLLAPVLVAAARASAALIPLVLVPLFAVYRMARLSVEQQQLASLDPLTGLPNRKALLAEVGEQVHLHAERAARGMPGARLALLLIDLDRFKNVNDALGHAVGDRLLVEVSARLTGVVGAGMVARLGGDEFAIVMTGLEDVDEARELAGRVVRALAEPVSLDGLPLDVGGSIGIAFFPEHGEDFATLMRHADVAMYDAKHRNDTVAIYTAESDHNSAERLALLADLRRVLEAGRRTTVPPGPAGAAELTEDGEPADDGAQPPKAGDATVAGVGADGSPGDGAVGAPAAAAPAGRLRGAGRAGAARGGDGAELPADLAGSGRWADPAGAGRWADLTGAGRWWLRRRRQRPGPSTDDELINRIVTAADPIRRRPAAAAETGPDRADGSGRRNGAERRGGQGGAVVRRQDPPGDHGARDAGDGLWDGDDAARHGGDGRTPTGRRGARHDATRRRDADPAVAVDAGEITMYYQPQIAIATGEVVGVEALLRWRHPRRGMVDPEELIRVAEQSAVMRLLTRRVVDDVVEQLAKWSAAGMSLPAALNVSVRDLHTGEIADQIADRLARFGVPPQRLQLEITEGALMADPRRVLATITRLHRIGVGISLDDFGTGYSSLQHLRRLPLSEVKVDRSFVLGMAEDADDAAIVKSTIELAKALGLRVVAEGVEDERTWRMLYAAGCDAAQGWFYARPMPAEELVGWLARYRPVRPTPSPDAEIPRRHAR
ncbi:EAL domain-containing protein [Micromonospora sp. NPDC049048]|uniref:EAL domain-containing protein n=1 Tax=Micromonospora sp. NPDC049048 TaxID=3364263 RepID=UPI0037110DD9